MRSADGEVDLVILVATRMPMSHPAPLLLWDGARRCGVDFRAIGQEPGWLLEIAAGKSMYLLADYGEKKVTTPAPTPTRDSTRAITYDATTEEHHLTAVIRKRVCRDAMSGEEMTHEVKVMLDGKEFRGCGRQLT